MTYTVSSGTFNPTQLNSGANRGWAWLCSTLMVSVDFTTVQWMAFHMMCQCRILDVYWYVFVPNTSHRWTHSPGEFPQLDLHSQEAPGDLWTCLLTFYSQWSESGCRCMLRPHTWRCNTVEISSCMAVSHLEADTGLTTDSLWNIASDHDD